MKCKKCGQTIKPDKIIYTVKEFKERFEVGDIILGFSTRKQMEITAIGKERFLYVDLCVDGRERVQAIEGQHRWEKLK